MLRSGLHDRSEDNLMLDRARRCFRLSTGLQAFGVFRIGWRYRQELGHVNRQGGSEPLQHVNGRVEFRSLKATDISPINLRIDRQILLGDALFGPYSAQIPGNACSSIHGTHATNSVAFKPSNIFDIYALSCTFNA